MTKKRTKVIYDDGYFKDKLFCACNADLKDEVNKLREETGQSLQEVVDDSLRLLLDKHKRSVPKGRHVVELKD